MKKIFTLTLMMLLMVSSAIALQINSPENQVYDDYEILLSIGNNETYDSIYYTIDEGAEMLTCSNCSEHNETLNLSEGEHTITVYADLGNETINESVDFEIQIIDFDLEISSPDNITYYTSDVPIWIFADQELDSIELSIDGLYDEKCENCAEFNDTVNLTDGVYTLDVTGKLDNDTLELSVDFEVDLDDDEFDLEIIRPNDITYHTPHVPIRIYADQDLDSIEVMIDGAYEKMCENCDSFFDILDLDDGNYTLEVTGKLGNATKELSVDFQIDFEEFSYNETPRFTGGLNKLPQMLESGELSDGELAEIIKNNKLNPGIINRLIKSRLLEEESLEAILQTQWQPPGIFKKFMGWFGFKQKSYATLVYEHYDLDEDIKQQMISRRDLYREYADNIREEFKERMRERLELRDKKISNDENPDFEPLRIGAQAKNGGLPPGLAKKYSGDNGFKVPPGHAKARGRK